MKIIKFVISINAIKDANFIEQTNFAIADKAELEQVYFRGIMKKKIPNLSGVMVEAEILLWNKNLAIARLFESKTEAKTFIRQKIKSHCPDAIIIPVSVVLNEKENNYSLEITKS